MGDPVLNEALQRLAVEAATQLSSLVASGEEIPFDIAEEEGESTLFYRYVPLTGRFVADHQDEIRSLPSFEPACVAVDGAGVAAPYLESRGLPVPADPGERAENMLLAFLIALWDGCAEFSIDRPRLAKALNVLAAEAREPHEADFLVAPIVGLQMPVASLQLPSGVRVVRADAVEAPIDAMRSEGMQRAAWEPQFLALAEQGDGPEGSTEAMRQLRDLVSVLRLFREGGVALGPYVFAPTGEGRWRRLATGAVGTRPGAYKLTEAEARQLEEFARRLEAQPDPDAALRWAIARFEMGTERASALEGLSDHLLALRAVLEGEGPVEVSLPVRAAALIAPPETREATRDRIERAFELERMLMTGAELAGTDDAGTALGLATWIEDGVRSLLRDAALGALRDNLAEAADEELILTGLTAGEISAEERGETSEWEVLEPAEEDAEPVDEESTGILEPAPQLGEIRVTAAPAPGKRADGALADESRDDEPLAGESTPGEEEEEPGATEPEPEPREESEMTGRDWLSEVSREATLEWPAPAGERRPHDRERIDSPRVRHLFQVPDDADWDISELEYDRRKAGVR